MDRSSIAYAMEVSDQSGSLLMRTEVNRSADSL